jgi:hypothetical protein
MLEKEIETYNKVIASLKSRYTDGGFVVIKGDEVIGVWQTRVDALKSGFEKFGDVQFLVKNIDDQNIVANYSRNLKFA